jgi:putative polyhydroxyalkanoate system protein
MSDIHMIKHHSLPLEAARALVQKAADGLADEYNLVSDWRGNTLVFERSGVRGSMEVLGAEIRLDITLGFLLKPFRQRFVDNIERNFDHLLAAAYEKSSRSTAAKAAKKSARTAARKAPPASAKKTVRKP